VTVAAGEKCTVYFNGTDYVKVASSVADGVASVTGTAPVVSSGGTTPAISMAAANGSTNGYLTSTDWTTFNNKGSGTVTAVSVATANGFAGSSSGGATPALTLSTSVTGLLKGNGTAISAATSGSDYAPATSGSSILYGNGSGGFSNVTVGTGVSFTGGTLSATGSGGTLTNVTASSPLSSSGGTTPNISISSSTGTGAVVLASSPTLVTPALGTPSSGNLANCTFPTLNQNTTGTAAGLSTTLAVTSGGTGVTSSTGTGSVVLSSSPTLATPNITSGITLTGSAGTSGQVLTSAGSGSAPTWSSPGGLALLATFAPPTNGAASVAVTGLSSYKAIQVVLSGAVISSGSSQYVNVSSDNGSTYSTDYQIIDGTTASTAVVTIYQTNASSTAKPYYPSSTGLRGSITDVTGVINAVRIKATGTYTGVGVIYIYGMN
jgi:hypothetical protein